MGVYCLSVTSEFNSEGVSSHGSPSFLIQKRPDFITSKGGINDPNEAKAVEKMFRALGIHADERQAGHKQSIGGQGAGYSLQLIFSMTAFFPSRCDRFQQCPDHHPWDEYEDLRQKCSLELDWKNFEKNVWPAR